MRSLIAPAAVILATLAIVQFALIDFDGLLLAALGIAAGVIAMLAFVEPYIEEAVHRTKAQTVGEIAADDPFEFGRLIADEYARLLDDADGDVLAAAERSAVYLADSLEQNARRARVDRYEELLQSRTFVP